MNNNSPKMRAKMRVDSVLRLDGSGSDEDNTYAEYTPSASIVMSITNPELIGAFNPGDAFYVDFTPVLIQPPDA